MIYGTWQNEEPQACAIESHGSNSVIEYNRVDSTGFIGIYFVGDNVDVRYNYITNSVMRNDDAGGIYTVGYPRGTGRKIYNNIVLNNAGTSSGTNGSSVMAYGIYTDDYSNGVEIFNNTVSNCATGGIYIHLTDSANVHNNLSYNNGNYGQLFLDGNGIYLRNAKIYSNILIAKTTVQRTATYKAPSKAILNLYGEIDSNYYARPIDGNANIDPLIASVDLSYTLSQWQSYSGAKILTRFSQLAPVSQLVPFRH